MVAATIGPYALTVIALVVLVVAVIIARLLRRDSGVRVARLGVFVERERFVDPDTEPFERHWPDDDDTLELPPPDKG